MAPPASLETVGWQTGQGRSMTTAVVVGGGLAGSSCAVALAGRGVEVTVLEAGERLGGRASSWRDGHTGDTVDIGPHIFHPNTTTCSASSGSWAAAT
ncbi:NAD(P)/FAD-dependent oxidoreductase [Massilia sp. Se16.2.3]|nr:NAD(P)/FAD-dependent oxidoreductase [Massilia sp. Se16.2.3]